MSKGIMANSILNAAAGMLLLVTGFACSIIAARMLGPEANGIIAFALWLAITGALVAELGSGVLLMRMLPKLKAEGYDEKRRRGFAALLLTPTLISTTALAILYALIVFGSEELHWVDTAPSIALMTGVIFVIQSIGAFSKNYLIGEQRVSTFFVLTFIASVLQLATVLAGAYYYGVEGALVGYAAGQVALFVYTLPLIVHRRDFCDTPIKFLMSSSLMLSAGYVVDSIFLNRIEILFLQQFWSVQMVGFYAVSLSLANLALQLPIQLTGSLLPYYSARSQTDDEGRLSTSVFSGVIRALSYITLPMSFGLAAIATPLVTTIFGAAFEPAGPMVALLALSSPAYVLMQILTQYLFSIDMIKSRLFAGVIGSVIIVVGCLIAVPSYAGEAAASVRIVAFIVMCMAMIRMTGFGKNLHKLYSSLAKVTASSLVVAGVALLASDALPNLLGLVLAIVLGAIAYPIGLKLTRAIPAEDGDMLRAMANKLPGRAVPIAHRFVSWLAPVMAETAVIADDYVDPNGWGAGRQAALPMGFAGVAALFAPESPSVERRDTAALLLPAWGFEELCARKFYRILSEELAEAGIANLRFDYPGTGDSLDVTEDAGLDVWERAVLEAAGRLRALTGLNKLVLIGQAPGAALAHNLAERLGDVSSIVMLAPMLSGRHYIRETALMSIAVDQGLGLRDDQRDRDGVNIAGFKMQPSIADAIRKINLGHITQIGAPNYLILSRPNSGAEQGFADAATGLGADVTLEPFEGYEALVANPTIQIMPVKTAERIAAWLREKSAVDPSGRASERPAAAEPLVGDGFVERAVRFGAGDNLYGVICEPTTRNADAPATLILTTAYDRAAGWGRSGVETARRLAREGAASLRYDAANVGDSPPVKGAQSQVLYSTAQIRDARAGLDLLHATFGGDMVLNGRCSGGYVALRTAHLDRRVIGVASFNPYTFFWDPSKPVSESMQFVPRSLDDYGQRLARLETLKRLIAGDIDVRAAARNISIALGNRLLERLKPILRFIDSAGPEHHETMEMFKGYHGRNLDIRLAYSEGDVGLQAMRRHFGEKGEGLAAFSNVRLIMIADADHNLSPGPARETMYSEILALAAKSKSGQ